MAQEKDLLMTHFKIYRLLPLKKMDLSRWTLHHLTAVQKTSKSSLHSDVLFFSRIVNTSIHRLMKSLVYKLELTMKFPRQTQN